ncbi:MAG: hypothetical protein J6X02_03705 [Bacilli bacterium]|nr:hypothetical protein [Bacilli bacterium]
MKYKELEKRSIKHANSIAIGYDRDYYNKIYNEYLVKEVNNCLSNNNLIDINEKELVELINIYQKIDKDNYLHFVDSIMNHSRRRLDYSKVIDLFVNN